MTTEENKAIVRRMYEEFSKRNLDANFELHAADYIIHLPRGVEVHGLERYKQMTATLLSAFPDYQETIEDIVAEGDKVVVRQTITGTHKGDFQGIAPTGKQVTWTAIAILRVIGDKLVESWIVADTLGLLQQLRANPSQ